jgi:hypothetical protein
MQARDHTFAVYWPNAASVDLTADFLPRPVSMTSNGDGWWRVEVPLPDSECEYHFLVDGCYHVPDYSAGDPRYDAEGNLVSVISGRHPLRAGRPAQGQPLRRPTLSPVITSTESRAGHHPQAG